MSGCKRNRSDFPKHEQSQKIKTIGPMEAPADGEIPDLPEEIVIQILKFLPVKSLLRFRCVCKLWVSLISSSGFIKTHLNANLINQRIMITSVDEGWHFSAHSLMFEPLIDAFENNYAIENPMDERWGDIWVVGFCNGLMCFSMFETDVFIWNPSTRRSIFTSPCVKLDKGLFYTYGFGYNESDDDYKIVGIFCYSINGRVYKTKVKIYSLRSDSWKRIGDFEGGVPSFHDPGKFASGKLHFKANPETYSDYEFAIVSLDLKTEVYGKVELPNYEEGYHGTLVGVLGGCICLTLNYRDIRTDVWVLNEYDVKESWTKLVSIPYVDALKLGIRSRDIFSSDSNHPLLMLSSGEILLVFAHCLLIYNPKDNSFRRPVTSNIARVLKADTYAESLVSLGKWEYYWSGDSCP